MADLEEHALRRDGRFLVRLVVFLILAAAFGFWAVSHLTGDGFAGCVARTFSSSSGE